MVVIQGYHTPPRAWRYMYCCKHSFFLKRKDNLFCSVKIQISNILLGTINHLHPLEITSHVSNQDNNVAPVMIILLNERIALN